MVKVKGVEWGHVLVVKEPARHGMATLVKCAHCGKEFQGNAMRIRAHLLGNKRSAGVSGCPSCPEEAREELRLIDLAKSQVKRKRQDRTPRAPRATSSASDHSLESGQQIDIMAALQKGEKSAVEHAFRSMVFQAGGLPVNFVNLSPVKSAAPILAEATDLESFFDGFGIRPETISIIKEMGFTGKTFMSNVDEILALLESIKQHCHLSVGEEWGIKGAAKKWQKDHAMVFTQPELEKWPETDHETSNGCKEVMCIPSS